MKFGEVELDDIHPELLKNCGPDNNIVCPCKTLYTLLKIKFSNMQLTVYIKEEKIKTRVLNYRLPQDLVLVLILFKWYTKYLPLINLKKFIYADDTELANQSYIFGSIENSQTNDLDKLH